MGACWTGWILYGFRRRSIFSRRVGPVWDERVCFCVERSSAGEDRSGGFGEKRMRGPPESGPLLDLDIQVLHIEGVFLDELTAAFDVLTHEGRENLFAFDEVFQAHLE